MRLWCIFVYDLATDFSPTEDNKEFFNFRDACRIRCCRLKVKNRGSKLNLVPACPFFVSNHPRIWLEIFGCLQSQGWHPGYFPSLWEWLLCLGAKPLFSPVILPRDEAISHPAGPSTLRYWLWNSNLHQDSWDGMRIRSGRLRFLAVRANADVLDPERMRVSSLSEMLSDLFCQHFLFKLQTSIWVVPALSSKVAALHKASREKISPIPGQPSGSDQSAEPSTITKGSSLSFSIHVSKRESLGFRLRLCFQNSSWTKF